MKVRDFINRRTDFIENEMCLVFYDCGIRERITFYGDYGVIIYPAGVTPSVFTKEEIFFIFGDFECVIEDYES